jgi:hypothetical protein
MLYKAFCIIWRFLETAVGLGTYYSSIPGHTCIMMNPCGTEPGCNYTITVRDVTTKSYMCHNNATTLTL